MKGIKYDGITPEQLLKEGSGVTKRLIKNTNTQRVLFVLGSGVSSRICPDVQELTRTVLNPNPKWFGYDQDKEFRAIVDFLKALEEHARPTTGACTYEDLFSMCDQLAKFELGIIPDPALRLFRDKIYEESKSQWAFYAQEDKSYLQKLPLAAISQKAQHAIHTVIRRALISKNDPGNQLNLIAEVIHKLGPGNVDILTLNHDCLVEALLDRQGIKWTDGFDSRISQDGDVINFDAQAFEHRSRVRIVKMHGGCDWHYAGTSIENFRWVKNPTESEIDLCSDAHGDQFRSIVERAPTLTGTTTKASAYTEGVHAELYIEAKKLLTEHDRIICSGYGWNDYGFNTMLAEWGKRQLWHEKTRRHPQLLLLHTESKLGEFKHPKNHKHLRRNLWFWPLSWEEDLSLIWNESYLDWFRCHKKWLSCTRFSEIEDLFSDQ
ncbi:hypothetical protein QEH52_00240 [Coraliomargarita sp. SDUM461003]|uniref:SIR2-like domain-containing protein n=1 Tax=Thalassobacterium maritimum TaxID=3041265 RepID=A0ABU1AQM2_9BACT|nr:hypothetical protein [Coraliomargarita sp. SDUM461003]MDQ8205922.1 hypothetical protein [Coraliomargarita sp. SDUM461003]